MFWKGKSSYALFTHKWAEFNFNSLSTAQKEFHLEHAIKQKQEDLYVADQAYETWKQAMLSVRAREQASFRQDCRYEDSSLFMRMITRPGEDIQNMWQEVQGTMVHRDEVQKQYYEAMERQTEEEVKLSMLFRKLGEVRLEAEQQSNDSAAAADDEPSTSDKSQQSNSDTDDGDYPRSHQYQSDEEQRPESIPEETNTQPPSSPAVSTIDTPPSWPELVAEWRHEVDHALNDRSAMTHFPIPPSRPCEQERCVRNGDGPGNMTCECNVRDALIEAGVDLRRERHRWHPDKFSRCREHLRGDMQRKAHYMFTIISAMTDVEEK